MGSSEGQWRGSRRWQRDFSGSFGKSQTRVPGLALSCPYHCTSASSEHKGLLRKQLSLKDLRRKRGQDQNDMRELFVFSQKVTSVQYFLYNCSLL